MEDEEKLTPSPRPQCEEPSLDMDIEINGDDVGERKSPSDISNSSTGIPFNPSSPSYNDTPSQHQEQVNPSHFSHSSNSFTYLNTQPEINQMSNQEVNQSPSNTNHHVRFSLGPSPSIRSPVPTVASLFAGMDDDEITQSNKTHDGIIGNRSHSIPARHSSSSQGPVQLQSVLHLNGLKSSTESGSSHHGSSSIGSYKKREDGNVVVEQYELLNEGTRTSVVSNLMLYEDDGSNRNSVSVYLQRQDTDQSAGGIPPTSGRPKRVGKKMKKLKLNTIVGVFLPCLQNVFGIILFVRLTWIVGLAGVGFTLIYLLMAICCTLLTTISMSAIATNGLTAPGGAYYMISRSLGRDLGGAVGILFYISTSVAISIYVLGAVEIITNDMFPSIALSDSFINARVYGTAILVILLLFEFIGLKFITRLTFIFILYVIMSLFSILIGAFASSRLSETYPDILPFPGRSNLMNNFGPGFEKPDVNGIVQNDVSWLRLFGIFFPCVTGIMAGANKSGSLRNPAKSIPKGTFSAIAFSGLIYTLFILLFGSVVSGPLLRTKKPESGLLVATISWPHPVVTLIGCLLSSLGASLQCFTGAPRILQALAKDEIIPILRRLKLEEKGEPRRAIIVTFLVAWITVMIGDLDIMAPATTMTFLVTYTSLNSSCALLSFIKSPNWRPTFKHYHFSLSLLGSLFCLVFMFLINWFVAIILLVVVILLYKYVEYTGARVSWGDGVEALELHVAQRGLINLERKVENEMVHVRNWRPQIIAFIPLEDPNSSQPSLNDQTYLNPSYPHILSFLSQLRKGGGLTIVCSIMVGEFKDIVGRSQYKAVNQRLRDLLVEHQVEGFGEVLICKDLQTGVTHSIQAAGIGVLRPNTVLLGFPERLNDVKKSEQFVEIIRNVIAFDKVAIILKGVRSFPLNDETQYGNIDVYWIVHDGGILTLLPWLLKRHAVWRKCKLRIFAIAQLTDNSILMKQQLKLSLEELRIDAEADVIELGDYDISEFAYEKTIKMQERHELLKRLHSGASGASGTSTASWNTNASSNLNNERETVAGSTTALNGQGSSSSGLNLGIGKRKKSLTQSRTRSRSISTTFLAAPSHHVTMNYGTPLPPKAKLPDKKKVDYMNTSVKVNSLMKQRSSDSQLIFCNLPAPAPDMQAVDYLEYLEVLCSDLPRMVLIKGSGCEVITSSF